MHRVLPCCSGENYRVGAANQIRPRRCTLRSERKRASPITVPEEPDDGGSRIPGCSREGPEQSAGDAHVQAHEGSDDGAVPWTGAESRGNRRAHYPISSTARIELSIC